MGIQDRKTREKMALRTKIMEVTAAILVAEGYEKTTIRKVAAAIEYSPRTVYLYFKDKDALLMEIIEEGFAATLSKRERVRENLDFSKPEAIFEMQVSGNIDMALSSPNMYKAILYLVQFKAYPPGPNQKAVTDMVRTDLAACFKAAGRQTGDLDRITGLIFSFIRSYNLYLINLNEKLTPEKLAEEKAQCLDMILKGIIQL